MDVSETQAMSDEARRFARIAQNPSVYIQRLYSDLTRLARTVETQDKELERLREAVHTLQLSSASEQNSLLMGIRDRVDQRESQLRDQIETIAREGKNDIDGLGSALRNRLSSLERDRIAPLERGKLDVEEHKTLMSRAWGIIATVLGLFLSAVAGLVFVGGG